MARRERDPATRRRAADRPKGSLRRGDRRIPRLRLHLRARVCRPHHDFLPTRLDHGAQGPAWALDASATAAAMTMGERGVTTYQSFHAPPQVTVRMAAAELDRASKARVASAVMVAVLRSAAPERPIRVTCVLG